MPMYELIDEGGAVIERRRTETAMPVGEGAAGEYARMRLAAEQPVDAPAAPILTAEALAAALEKKGVLNKAEIDAEKGKK